MTIDDLPKGYEPLGQQRHINQITSSKMASGGEGDRAELIRSEQETAASEDLEAIRALAAAADGDSAIEAEAADGSAERHDVTSATAMDTTTEGGTTSAGNSAVDASSGDKEKDGSKSSAEPKSSGKRPPESGGEIHAEDEARHSHSHHHEWLAERHAHTRVGTDFQVAALPTPHPHLPPTEPGGNGANGSGGGGGGGAKLDINKEG